MATVLDIQSNRAIQFSGAEKMTRTFVKDPNAVDIRIGVVVSAPINGAFNPPTSIYETFQFGLINSGRTAALTTTNILTSTVANRKITYGGTLGTNHGLSVSSVCTIGGTKLSYELNGVTGANGDGVSYTSTWNIGDSGRSQSSLMMLRIYKTNANGSNFRFEIRGAGYASPSTYENSMHDMLSNLGNTYLDISGNRWHCDFTTNDPTNWDSLDTVVLAWPFYNAPFNVHAMGYRSLHS